MSLKYSWIVIIKLFIRFCVAQVTEDSPELDDDGNPITTPKPVANPYKDAQNITRDLLDSLLNHDNGRYVPNQFKYFKAQHNYMAEQRIDPVADKCYDDYMKCTADQIRPYYVCAYNDLSDQGKTEGRSQYNTICEVWLDNCMRQMRYWFIVDYGWCYWHVLEGYIYNTVLDFTVVPPYRRLIDTLRETNTDKTVLPKQQNDQDLKSVKNLLKKRNVKSSDDLGKNRKILRTLVLNLGKEVEKIKMH